jgi:hypothetical protein
VYRGTRAILWRACRHTGIRCDNAAVDESPLIGLNWFWISIQATAPLVLGHLLAYPFWRKNQAIFGNVVGTGVMFTSAFAMILREHAVMDILVQRCLDAGTTCWPEPAALTRYAIYAFIALIQVFILFSLSLRVEEAQRSHDYAPEWR